MGKAAKGSRKGKKAWRANISTADIDDYYEKATIDALSGASTLPSLPSDSLFYHDKKSNDEPIGRKFEKQREKVLHHESILQKNPFLKPVPSSNSMKSKKKKGKEIHKEDLASQVVSEANNDDDSAMPDLDIWAEKGKTADAQFKKPNSTIPTIIPAVEIEAPGCSFNPPFEAHQDSLAKAVADEMQKVYKKELGPEPVPLTVTGEIIPEEEKFFLDADDGDDSEGEELEEGADQADAAQRKGKTKKVTRVVLNRRMRRKEVLRAEAEAKKLQNFSKEIDSLPDIMKEIEKEDEEKEKRHTRRIVARQERLKAAPPRIGKRKFEPAPIQVLLSEEITGSLRKLKGCCTLARDRYKSIEKRGLIAPTKKARR
ncbi:hypothetical protein LUZ60_013460 [Juncus effusus]|nr:hypothetical protein LUZ60_013460 [Juncus effusus]